MHPDVEYPRDDSYVLGRFEKVLDGSQHIAPHIGHKKRREPEVLELGRRSGDRTLVVVESKLATPNANASEVRCHGVQYDARYYGPSSLDDRRLAPVLADA